MDRCHKNDQIESKQDNINNCFCSLSLAQGLKGDKHSRVTSRLYMSDPGPPNYNRINALAVWGHCIKQDNEVILRSAWSTVMNKIVL